MDPPRIFVVTVNMTPETSASPSNSGAVVIPKVGIFNNPKALLFAAVPEACSRRPRVEVTPGDDIPLALVSDVAVAAP